jgi:hypothetical protein
MKRFKRLALLAVLLVVGIGLGLTQYLDFGKRGETTERAATAIMDAASTAANWASDKSKHRVEIVNLMGHGRGGDWNGPVAVQAVLIVDKSAGLSAVCASLPRVRDAVNILLSDRISHALRTGGSLSAQEVEAQGDRLKSMLNRSFENEPIAEAILTLRNDYNAVEVGCTDPRSAQRRK